MTEITHGRVLRIAGPIVLSNATVPLLGAVDTAVIGQLGEAASLGAVGIGAVILATLYWAFGFLRMSTSGLAAQAQGAGDAAERSAVLIRALIVGGVAGLALVIAQVVLFAGAFALAPASPEVEGLARDYLAIRIWGAPATIALYALTGWLVGLERTRGVLVLQLWQNGLNIVLDLWFVLGLGWGVPGVAAATLIAEWTGLLLALWLARDAFGPGLRQALARLGDPASMRRMFSASRDIMGRTILLQLSFTTFVFLGARFGDVTLAANQVLMQFLEITAYALDGFAFAAEALIGQAVGARSVADTRMAGRICMQWGFGGAIGLALVFALAGPGMIDLMTTAPDVQSEARSYLPWLVVAPLIGVAAWIYDGIFIGALLTGVMLRAMLASVVVYGLALVLLVPVAGNHGLWAALMVLNATRTVTLWRLYPKVLQLAGRGTG
ncbi:MAG: MATE family efflux transporter [Tabrizicola sp.]|nr:MATE family efflux transporter [Tabrizicola sp.]